MSRRQGPLTKESQTPRRRRNRKRGLDRPPCPIRHISPADVVPLHLGMLIALNHAASATTPIRSNAQNNLGHEYSSNDGAQLRA
eukprot:9472529-Pyramimonas_sp.AAC.1